MITFELPDGMDSGGHSSFDVERLEPLDSLYSSISKCEPETLSQALDKYVGQLRSIGLPEEIAADYMTVETLFAIAALLRDCGCAGEVIVPNMTCPRFTSGPDRLEQCHTWSRNLLQGALAYRSRYNGRTGSLGIVRARYFIDTHYTDAELMLKDAAAEAKMSSSRFSTLFAREVGMTFTEYVTALRIQKAGDMLAKTSMRIALIAAKVGYNDPHYFSWIFKKNTGYTPTEYREHNRDESDK